MLSSTWMDLSSVERQWKLRWEWWCPSHSFFVYFFMGRPEGGSLETGHDWTVVEFIIRNVIKYYLFLCREQKAYTFKISKVEIVRWCVGSQKQHGVISRVIKVKSDEMVELVWFISYYKGSYGTWHFLNHLLDFSLGTWRIQWVFGWFVSFSCYTAHIW
jgi:hypothetical protein